MSRLSTLLKVSSIISCLSMCYVMGQETEKAPAETAAVVYEVEGHKVEHTWTSKGDAIFGENGIERWRHYMHGLTDEKAQPFNWASLLSSDDELLLSGVRVRGDFVNSSLYSLCLDGGRSVRLVRPAVTMRDLSGKSGQIIRFHVWMKGEGTGQGGSLWNSAPRITMWLQDSQGTEFARAESLFKTRGTFPWFCYTMSIRIPATFSTIGETGMAGGIYMELTNPVSGKVWFCTPSWETVSGNAPDLLNGTLDSSWIDPKRGTFAPNPDYDEMAMNFFFGLPEDDGVIWKFLDGNFAARSIVQNYDVKAYLNSVSTDWFAMTQAVPYLLYVSTAGTFLKHAPSLQPGWGACVVQTLADMQNTQTGLWEVNGKGNLMVSYLIARECFSPFRQVRLNEKPVETSWRAAGLRLPHAEELATSVLAAQMSRNGVLAGWNKYAFQGEDLLKGSRDAVMFDVRFSAAAVSLLSQCLPEVGEATKKRINAAIRAAYDYAVKNVMDENWLWCTDESKGALSLTPFGFLFIEGTQALDFRTDSTAVRKPTLDIQFPEKGRLSLSASGASANIVSYRVYAQPLDTTGSAISEKNLIAIIRASDGGPADSDPLYLLRRFSDAQRAEGIARYMTADIAGADYLIAKLAILNNCLIATMNSQGTATIALPDKVSGCKISVFAADAYGVMSTASSAVAP